MAGGLPYNSKTKQNKNRRRIEIHTKEALFYYRITLIIYFTFIEINGYYLLAFNTHYLTLPTYLSPSLPPSLPPSKNPTTHIPIPLHLLRPLPPPHRQGIPRQCLYMLRGTQTPPHQLLSHYLCVQNRDMRAQKTQ